MVLESSSLVQTTVVLGGLGYTGTTLPPVHKAVTLRGYMRWILAAFTLIISEPSYIGISSSSLFRKFGSRERLLSSKTDWLVGLKYGRTSTKNWDNRHISYDTEGKKVLLTVIFTNSSLSPMLELVSQMYKHTAG